MSNRQKKTDELGRLDHSRSSDSRAKEKDSWQNESWHEWEDFQHKMADLQGEYSLLTPMPGDTF
jgi:hypothetical protein